MKILYCDNDLVRVVVEHAENIQILEDKIVYDGGFIHTSDKSKYLIVDDDVSPDSINVDQTLDFHKKVKIDDLNTKCEQAIAAGFQSQTTGHFYKFDVYDQLNFLEAKESLTPQDQSITWKTEDAGPVVHTVDQFLQVCEEAKQHKWNCINKYWTLKQQVLNATTHEEINAIQW